VNLNPMDSGYPRAGHAAVLNDLRTKILSSTTNTRRRFCRNVRAYRTEPFERNERHDFVFFIRIVSIAD